MDVRKILVSEFTNVFSRSGYPVTEQYLKVAESPFNIEAVQIAVDNDIDRIRQESRLETELEKGRIIQIREQVHEKQLRKLARQYALKILRYARENKPINESLVLNEQQNMKAEDGESCDVYPCDQPKGYTSASRTR